MRRLSFRTTLQDDTPRPQLAHQPQQCQDCDLMVENRKLRITYSHNANSIPHRKVRCDQCKRYLNPDSGLFEYSQSDIAHHFKRRLRKRRDK